MVHRTKMDLSALPQPQPAKNAQKKGPIPQDRPQ
jgi:hypothetical protein